MSFHSVVGLLEFKDEAQDKTDSIAKRIDFLSKGLRVTCTIYIDESGDTGISKIRDAGAGGSSPFFCMGATVMRPASQIDAKKLLDGLQKEFNKPKRWKHATDLNHAQKVHFAKRLAEKRIRFYGLISDKSTLKEYRQEINWEPHKFYNKCIAYLLELVAIDLAQFGSKFHEPKIIVEKRNHDYDALRRYIGKIKDNPLHTRAKSLSHINPFGLVAETKEEEDLLRVADFVSHSLYSCVNKTPDNFGNVETRYWEEISKRFAANKSGLILGSGLKCIHSVADVGLDRKVKMLFQTARAHPAK